MTDAKVQAVRDGVSDLLDKIKSYFKPGVKITLVVRTPDLADRDFILTDDSPGEAIAAISRTTGTA